MTALHYFATSTYRATIFLKQRPPCNGRSFLCCYFFLRRVVLRFAGLRLEAGFLFAGLRFATLRLAGFLFAVAFFFAGLRFATLRLAGFLFAVAFFFAGAFLFAGLRTVLLRARGELFRAVELFFLFAGIYC
jgi:hypothetical protein